jgi:hypothetical protein
MLALALALGACASSSELRDFTTDGCSLFPDTDDDACWADCCVQHDREYWRGGTAAERERSDAALRECVARAGRPGLAGLMHAGVRLGGLPLWPTWFRWGYGWGYGRGYEPLAPAERQLAEEKLAAHQPQEADPGCR